MTTPARNLRPSHRVTHFIAMGLLTAASAQAGFVTWSLPQTISGDGDVSTAGTSVAAYNLGTSGNPSATVNGVTFTPFATTGAASTTVGNVTLSSTAAIFGDNDDFGDIVAPFTTLSPDYQTLLQSGSYTTSVFPPPTISMTLNGLTPGAQYQFQWWANEPSISSFAAAPGAPSTTATSGNSVTLDRNSLAGDLGQFALGVFTATSVSQLIDFNGSDTKTLLNAFQLRQLSAPVVPEPGSALFGLAVAGVAFRTAARRRR